MRFWIMWSDRNAIVWNDRAYYERPVETKAEKTTQEWKLSKQTASSEKQWPRLVAPINWKKPKVGTLKCNVDASVNKANDRIGFGMTGSQKRSAVRRGGPAHD